MKTNRQFCHPAFNHLFFFLILLFCFILCSFLSSMYSSFSYIFFCSHPLFFSTPLLSLFFPPKIKFPRASTQYSRELVRNLGRRTNSFIQVAEIEVIDKDTQRQSRYNMLPRGLNPQVFTCPARVIDLRRNIHSSLIFQSNFFFGSKE